MCEVPLKRRGTSHIAPPDMNSYVKKYEFISSVTYNFVHMNSYVSGWYIKKMATDEGGGGVGGVTQPVVWGSNPKKSTHFLY
jgi:hypothetical protein